MINPKNGEEVIELSRDKELFRLLLSFSQTGTIGEILTTIQNGSQSLHVIGRAINEIPGLTELIDEFNAFQAYRAENRGQEFLYLTRIVPGQPSKETKERAERIKTKFRVVFKWASELGKTAFQLRQSGLLVTPTANPNRQGKHYLAALKVAQELTNYWFVKKVILFGSVASGTERPDSDVDISVHLFDSRAIVFHILDYIKEEYTSSLKTRISFLVQEPTGSKTNKAFFSNAGFFEASEVLFERDCWQFKIRDITYDFSESNYKLFYTHTSIKGNIYYCILFEKNGETICLVIVDNEPIATCSGFVHRKEKGFLFPLRVPKTIVQSRKLTKLDEMIIVELMEKLGY